MNNITTNQTVVGASVGVVEGKENIMNAREVYLKDLARRRAERTEAQAKQAKYKNNQPNKTRVCNRITVVEFDYTTMPSVVKILRTDNGYHTTETYSDKKELHNRLWSVVHSPKLLGLTIKTKYLSSDIKKVMSYCNMEGIACTVINTLSAHFNSRAELDAWGYERTIRTEESAMRDACFNLIRLHARELLPFINSPMLPQIVRDKLYSMDYDAEMSTATYSEGMNHGIIETSKGREEWSRTYTKFYSRYTHVDSYTGSVSNETLYDLLNAYINCKFYTEHNIPCEESWRHGISISNIDSYTSEQITDPVRIHFERLEDIVVPVSACSEGLQMYVN